jgi:hypothetical protein
MEKQTAVEWAMSQIIKGHFIGFAEEFQIIYDKAKAMEKEQIKEAFKHGELPPLFDNLNAEQYYNETYNK